MSQNITLNGILLAIASFIIGSWVVPKMEWIPNVARIWIFAFGIGLAVFAILINGSVQQQMSKCITNHATLIGGIWVTSIVIFIASGFTLQIIEKNFEAKGMLKATGNALVTEITQFVADRALSQPQATDQWVSSDVWFQKSRDYRNATDNQFTTRYRQRVVEFGYSLQDVGVITEDELKHLLWVSQPEYPTIQWVLDTLVDFNSRLK